MIAFDVLNIRQASRAVDRRIFLLVGAALAMGSALQFTGGAGYLARDRGEHLSGRRPCGSAVGFLPAYCRHDQHAEQQCHRCTVRAHRSKHCTAAWASTL